MPDDLLRRLAAEPDRAAVLLDVDGVLAPIVERPEDARVPDETRDELARLAARYRLVACVSGRPSAQVEALVGVDGVAIVGEHGLELAPDAADWAERIAGFARGVDWPAEQKALSVSFHFRRADDEAAARAYLTRVAEAATAEGLVPRWGRMVLEVRPPVEAHKGTAVRALVARAGVSRALYAGDDTTDLDAFAGLAQPGSSSPSASPSTPARRPPVCARRPTSSWTVPPASSPSSARSERARDPCTVNAARQTTLVLLEHKFGLAPQHVPGEADVGFRRAGVADREAQDEAAVEARMREEDLARWR